jgi:hypothetical protein
MVKQCADNMGEFLDAIYSHFQISSLNYVSKLQFYYLSVIPSLHFKLLCSVTRQVIAPQAKNGYFCLYYTEAESFKKYDFISLLYGNQQSTTCLLIINNMFIA